MKKTNEPRTPTEAQINANRENAKKSTGPRTAEGKSASSRPARAFNVDCEGPNSFTKLARYETSIERSIDRCLRQLKTYQAARTASTPQVGQAVRLPKPIPPKWGR